MPAGRVYNASCKHGVGRVAAAEAEDEVQWGSPPRYLIRYMQILYKPGIFLLPHVSDKAYSVFVSNLKCNNCVCL